MDMCIHEALMLHGSISCVNMMYIKLRKKLLVLLNGLSHYLKTKEINLVIYLILDRLLMLNIALVDTSCV